MANGQLAELHVYNGQLEKMWGGLMEDAENGSEADLINELASNVMGVLALTPSNDFDDFVGIQARVTKMKTMLSLQAKDVKVIGIWGPAGIGKTTAARVLYDQVSPEFQFSTFLENIKGCFKRSFGNDHQLKLRFQEKLLSQIFNQKDIVVRHLGGAPQKLSDQKVLVVLDEVDSWWQLEEVANRAWFGRGSMVIISTEDRKLLKALGLEANQIYKMKFPTTDEALQILCLYAFGQKFPNYDFETLAWEVTELAGNLPLGLRVMGSYLRGMSKKEWIDALPSLRSSLDSEIESTLKLSYNVLSNKEKSLFLHIACFFAGFKVDRVKSILEKSDLNVNHGLQTLAYRSLIYRENGYVEMHSLKQQMGKEIGTGTVLGIKLLKLEGEEIKISKSAFQGIRNLQFLDIDGGTLNTPEGLNCLPNKLRYIHWKQSPLRFWPSKFSEKLLVELIMPNSNFEKLWEGIKPFPCLKRMDLSSSEYLKEIPDLSKATSLEILDLHYCRSLLELPSSIGRLINLEKLDLHYCRSLEKLSGCSSLKELDLSDSGIGALELPSSVSTWSCFYRLNMSGLSDLKKFPKVPYSIVELVLSGTGIEEVPPWIENLFRLQQLIMFGCRNLEIVSPNISKLENLQTIALCKHDDVPEMSYGDEVFTAVIVGGPDSHGIWRFRSDLNVHYILPICLPKKALTSPISLHLFSGGLKTIPDCIRRLSGLSELSITGCIILTELPQLPGSCLSLDAHFCRSLRRINSSFQNPNICLNFAGCYNLNQKARKLIQTSVCKYALLPDSKLASYCQKSVFITFASRMCFVALEIHHMPCLGTSQNHLYIFEDSFSLNQHFPEAEVTTFSELSFLFTVDDYKALVVAYVIKRRQNILKTEKLTVSSSFLSIANRNFPPSSFFPNSRVSRVSSFALSMEESTAANAATLRMELKKTMTEILDDGGVSEDRGETDGALVAVDEAVRILNRLREVESKMPDSATSSSSPASVLEVPKEFKCMLSRAIMSEPVVIASGQTYEKRYIQQWLMYKVTCPKTKEVLSHRLWVPNHVIAELITEWCQVNKYDLPKPSDAPVGLFPDDIDLLLERISSPSSVEDKTGAANELRRQTKRFADVPAFFVAEIPESITRLLTPLSALGEDIDSNPGLQKDIITALLYISCLEENKTAVAQHPLAIPLLTKSLKQGIAKTRRNSAEALWELSKLDSNKILIGNSETLEALVHVIKEDHFTAAIGAAYRRRGTKWFQKVWFPR
ncbi:hypothetical protein IGI04_009484 [Brassica rapa subsp. trilocularis]|uniref:RING-type E3 ubiquitin transferase n=1 Tax=Brassica rapa subsp. trilocularis TaxID=1813537 RepID=A0ABQ7MXE9_BRACM|nr:hypothetical protein IGI04_009484 [Brassica rapa subsp. trilocularis]